VARVACEARQSLTVCAGIDLVSKRRHYLREIVPAGPAPGPGRRRSYGAWRIRLGAKFHASRLRRQRSRCHGLVPTPMTAGRTPQPPTARRKRDRECAAGRGRGERRRLAGGGTFGHSACPGQGLMRTARRKRARSASAPQDGHVTGSPAGGDDGLPPGRQPRGRATAPVRHVAPAVGASSPSAADLQNAVTVGLMRLFRGPLPGVRA
jgi:hypothetical protein